VARASKNEIAGKLPAVAPVTWSGPSVPPQRWRPWLGYDTQATPQEQTINAGLLASLHRVTNDTRYHLV
jgi:hypothetical protein